MNTHDLACEALRSLCAGTDDGNGDAQVNTHCLYPSNGIVRVSVKKLNDAFLVSDDGGAIREALSSAIELNPKNQMRFGAIAEKQGLLFEGGAVTAPRVPREALALAIVLVANASKEIADSIFSHYKIKRHRDFKGMVQELLRSEFKQPPHEGNVVGQSTRAYRFENIISLQGGKRLLIDPVLRDANSINARVIANLDVQAVLNQDLAQRIIYDDEAGWETNELNVLHMTNVPVIAFSGAKNALRNLISA